LPNAAVRGVARGLKSQQAVLGNKVELAVGSADTILVVAEAVKGPVANVADSEIDAISEDPAGDSQVIVVAASVGNKDLKSSFRLAGVKVSRRPEIDVAAETGRSVLDDAVLDSSTLGDARTSDVDSVTGATEDAHVDVWLIVDTVGDVLDKALGLVSGKVEAGVAGYTETVGGAHRAAVRDLAWGVASAGAGTGVGRLTDQALVGLVDVGDTASNVLQMAESRDVEVITRATLLAKGRVGSKGLAERIGLFQALAVVEEGTTTTADALTAGRTRELEAAGDLLADTVDIKEIMGLAGLADILVGDEDGTVGQCLWGAGVVGQVVAGEAEGTSCVGDVNIRAAVGDGNWRNEDAEAVSELVAGLTEAAAVDVDNKGDAISNVMGDTSVVVEVVAELTDEADCVGGVSKGLAVVDRAEQVALAGIIN